MKIMIKKMKKRTEVEFAVNAWKGNYYYLPYSNIDRLICEKVIIKNFSISPDTALKDAYSIFDLGEGNVGDSWLSRDMFNLFTANPPVVGEESKPKILNKKELEKLMKNFKKGDTVTIREDISDPEFVSVYGLSSDMRMLGGKEFVISKVYTDKTGVNGIGIELECDNQKNLWELSCFKEWCDYVGVSDKQISIKSNQNGFTSVRIITGKQKIENIETDVTTEELIEFIKAKQRKDSGDAEEKTN